MHNAFYEIITIIILYWKKLNLLLIRDETARGTREHVEGASSARVPERERNVAKLSPCRVRVVVVSPRRVHHNS